MHMKCALLHIRQREKREDETLGWERLSEGREGSGRRLNAKWLFVDREASG